RSTLRRPPDLPRRVKLNQLFGLGPPEERVKDGDDVGTRRRAEFDPALRTGPISPGRQKLPEVGGCQPVKLSLGVVLGELLEDSPVRVDRARGGVTLEPTPVQKRIYGPLNP